MQKKYIARGLVWGNYWGSGRGGYKSETIEAKTMETLLKKANKMLADGSLDSGMGYESLVGAMLEIEEIETIKKADKEYQRSEYLLETIGELNEKEEEFLMENLQFN